MLWAITLSDRYFITKFVGLTETAVYSSSAMLAGLVALFYSPISLALLPQLSRLSAQNRKSDAGKYFESSIKLFLTLAIPTAIGVAIISQPLLQILTTSDFLAGREVVFLLALGGVFLGLYQLNINPILVDHRSKWLPLVTSTAYLTSVALNFVLVPRMGILGAAISNCVSFLVIAVVTTVWVKNAILFSLNLSYLGKVAAAAGAMLLSLTFFKVDTFLQMILAAFVGSAVFGVGLVFLGGISLKDGRNIWKTFGEVLKSLVEFKPKDKEKGA
ncbi:MAG: polysaccharide biosynthesis C-terminal domain-containing protein [Dehalococcoidales bacterium]|nr:polysaccharide biosynthesis C-terminal domain-containing protein [Dehalococcoidales bacterium]